MDDVSHMIVREPTTWLAMAMRLVAEPNVPGVAQAEL